MSVKTNCLKVSYAPLPKLIKVGHWQDNASSRYCGYDKPRGDFPVDDRSKWINVIKSELEFVEIDVSSNIFSIISEVNKQPQPVSDFWIGIWDENVKERNTSPASRVGSYRRVEAQKWKILKYKCISFAFPGLYITLTEVGKKFCIYVLLNAGK